jgi:hypothetical protein
MRTLPFGLRTLAAAALLSAAGCGSDSAALTPVCGKVYYQGMPLSRGTVVFIPDENRGNRGPLARAEIQPDGTYALRTDDADGAVPGWHKVTIVAVDDGPFATGPRSLLPKKYSDPGLSDLSYLVEPGKENGIDLRLQ